MSRNGEGPATKAELDAAVQRLDAKIDSSVQRLALEIVKAQEGLRQVKENMATKTDVNRIMNAIDSFAKKGEHYDRAAVLHGHALVEVQTTLKSHDKRLKAPELARR